ncbi:MAG: DUF3320 domain-containing protein, partial [archaeon]|nr:DUF3320 domain-containing protein [archaeon]
EFKDLDKQILLLNRKRIYQKLNNNMPKIFGATDNPEAKILAGEFTRKSGHLPVRKLLEKAGGTIKQIKPCFMMSPLSVAQYLDPTNEKLQFDVVIFDEASQVKPEDALGAFMRGKTAVVMGDTQQLPPTSFFEQLAADESEEEVATALDMESILHLCKLSFPVKMLKWHYRSRHESLISVSNTQFYDDELLVYPSPSHSDPELGLKFFYNPDTYYERGSGSKNPLEAKVVVKEIFNHFDKYGDTKSLGVGTFSVAQKNAILEELEVQRKARPELEPLFAESREERFFVKNLETIQGDERDVILISVGYGYDQEGKMSLNFGPLNQDGGERRLNVLITRAREKCVVFSNFKAHDMHMTANPPFGVKALSEFLEYAENLTLGTYVRDETPQSPFEDAIAAFLEENGYEVDKQIGCAGFRVDLAIKDPENPGKYFLGITTDGKMYASSKVARDRDRLREQVLTGLGWRLYHLWSTDWYRNRDLAKNKLLTNIAKFLEESRAEEKRKSDEAKRLAEQRKAEALKQAEELRLAREAEEAKKREEKEATENENITIIDPNLNDKTSEFVEVAPEKEDIIIKQPGNEFVTASEIQQGSEIENNTSEEYIETEDLGSEYIETEDDISEEIISEDIENDVVEDSSVNVNQIEEKPKTDKKSIFASKLSFDALRGKSELESYLELDDLEVKSKENDDLLEEIIADINDEENSEETTNIFEKLQRDMSDDDINNEESDMDSPDENNDEIKSSFLSKLKFNPFKSKGDIDEITEEEVPQEDIIEEVIQEDIIEPEVESVEEIQEEVDDIPEVEEVIEPIKTPKSEEIIKEDTIRKEEIFEEFEPVETIEVDHKAHDNIPNEDTEENKPSKETFDDEEKVVFREDVEEIYVDHEAHNKIPDELEDEETFKFSDIFMEDEHEIWEDESEVEKEYADIENKEIWEDNQKEENSSSKETREHSGVISSFITNLKEGESKLEPKYDANGNVVYKTEVIKDEIVDVSDKEEFEEVEIPIDDKISVIHEEENNKTIYNDVKDSIVDVDKDNMEFELEGQSPYDEYVVEKVNDNYYKDIKFKSNISLDKDITREKEDNMSPDERYSKEEKEYFKSQKDYYKGASGITNPLKKNNIYKLENENDNKSVRDTLSSIKSDVKYLNKSLKEIENPTPAEYVHVIDRTGEYVPEDEYTPDDSYLIIEKEEEETFEPYDYAVPVEIDISDSPVITPEINEVEHRRREEGFNKEDYVNIENPKDFIIPEENIELKKQEQDESLETIIMNADKQYKQIEKERFKENNTLKAFDDKKLPKKMGEIVQYEEAKNFEIKTTKDLYDKPLDDVANSIYKIIQIEAPVHKDDVVKRIKDSCEISRAGVKFKDSISTAIDHGEEMGNILKIGDFLFDAYNPEVTIRKRVKPNIDLISDEEIAKNLEGILLEKSTMEATDLTKKVARNFGFRSTSKKTAKRINTVLDRLIIEEKVLMDNDIVELK